MWLHLIEIVLSYFTFVTENIKCTKTSSTEIRENVIKLKRDDMPKTMQTR